MIGGYLRRVGNGAEPRLPLDDLLRKKKEKKRKKRPVNRLTNLKMSFLSVFMHPSTEVLVLADDQCIPRGLFVLAKLLVCLPHSVNFIFTSDFFATSFPESLLSKRRETLGTRLTSLSQ